MSWREITAKNRDGRVVNALVLGEPKCGRVVVYHHGFPASRLEALIARNCTSEFGICVVAIDRPGLGGSVGYASRVLADWPEDVVCIMDAIGVERFAVLAVSGGTPSAVTLAARLPERVLSLSVVSGVAPMHLPGALDGANGVNKWIMKCALRRPRLARRVISFLASLWAKAPWTIQLWFGLLLPKADKAVVSTTLVRGILRKSIADAFRTGTQGVVKEFELLASHWEEELAAVKVPTTVWHGTIDSYVPFSMGRILHERIKDSTFHEVPDGGHFMVIPRIRDILSEVVFRSWSKHTPTSSATADEILTSRAAI